MTASDGQNTDFFGVSVDIQSNAVVVGAARGDGLNANQGAAYIFTPSNGVWFFNSKLTANDGKSFDDFGRSVAVAGELVVVGAPGDDNNANANQGSAYVFMQNGPTWVQQQKLLAWDGMVFDDFGRSVAVAVDRRTVVVGAPDNSGTTPGNGAAYVFARPPNGPVWSPQQKLTASDGMAGDGFGHSVSILETTVVVGAPYDTIGTNAERGSAYTFERNPNNLWIPQQKLVASDGAAGDRFGFSVSIVYEQIGVGAPFDDIGTNSDQGSAYVFRRN